MSERALVSRATMEVATALATGAIGALVMWGALEHDIGWGDSGPAAGYFPFRIGVLIVLGSLANLILPVWKHGREGTPFVTREQAWRVASFGLPVLGFVIGSLFLGLYVAAFLYLVFVMVLQGGYRLIFALALAAGVVVLMRLIFPIWFKVPLLTGPIENLLGLY